MIIQATSHGTAAKEEPFAFTYSGDFTDNRVNGVGTVRLNTSGTLTVTGKAVTISATIVGAGGGGIYASNANSVSGGGGGIQDVEVTLEAGTYDIVIGVGGAGYANTSLSLATGGTGGNTTAFGKTSTGGTGGDLYYGVRTAGKGGTPNGQDGGIGRVAGGSPNGGSSTGTTAAANNGGDGYVELTFS